MKRLIITLIVFMFISGIVFGQATDDHEVIINIIEVEMIALDDDSDLTLTTDAPTDAGDVVVGTDSSADPRILSYTVLASADKQIHVAITDFDGGGLLLPAGTALHLTSTTDPAYGDDIGEINLTGAATTLINNIQSCHTGVGTGATLLYELIITDDTALVAGESETVTVTFTLTDE